MAGIFLVVEGPEGAGKTTLARGLARRLRSLGIDPVEVREPGGGTRRRKPRGRSCWIRSWRPDRSRSCS